MSEGGLTSSLSFLTVFLSLVYFENFFVCIEAVYVNSPFYLAVPKSVYEVCRGVADSMSLNEDVHKMEFYCGELCTYVVRSTNKAVTSSLNSQVTPAY